MATGDPKKPKGKMPAYAFFVQTCREEHKKKNPEVPVNFAEFSKKCSERWKTMSAKEKSKFDEMAKAYKVRYDQEMKDYGPAKGGKKKDPNAPKRPLSGFFLFCLKFHPKIKSTNPGVSIGDVAKKLGEMWNNLSDSEKKLYNNKAAKLKEKYEKDVADYISLKASLMVQRAALLPPPPLTPADGVERLGPAPAGVSGAGTISGYKRQLLPQSPLRSNLRITSSSQDSFWSSSRHTNIPGRKKD
ncbi:High mobility group protein B3 [Myotis brandtii]|uniref:High mobility group protein B3 n=1 Tax=Myotis brandtii TaxID=109478 RepID=S7PYP9_MYOBR|nr:High mobility group protein B3 [Myotis brandtii]